MEKKTEIKASLTRQAIELLKKRLEDFGINADVTVNVVEKKSKQTD